MPPREQPIGQPSVYRGIHRLPEVFSFVAEPVDADDREERGLCEAFNASREKLNSYYQWQNQKEPDHNYWDQLGILKFIERRLFDAERVGRVGILKAFLRNILGRAFFSGVFHDWNNVFDAVRLFNHVYEKLSDHLDTEIVWYWFVVQLKFYREYVDRAKAVAHFRLMLENIKYIRSQPHRDGLYTFLCRCLKEIEGYPDPELYRAFQAAFPERPIPVDGWCAINRHEFLSKSRENPIFFQIKPGGHLWNVDALERKGSQEGLVLDKTVCVVGKPLLIKVAVSQYALAMFSAHIVPPSHPKLLLEMANLNKETLAVVNSRAIKNLRAVELCDSDGSIKEDALENTGWPIFCEAILGAFRTEIPGITEALREPVAVLAKNRMQYKEQYNHMERVRDHLSGFNSIQALAFCYRCLIPFKYGLGKGLLGSVRRMTASCLSLDYLALQAYQKKESLPAFHRHLFDLAGEAVSYMHRTRDHLLVAVGTPIEVEKKKGYSTHALYVVFRRLPNDTYQVIITNGGRGVKQFHRQSEEMDGKDRQKYHYAAFKPFSLETREMQEALHHYLYVLIATEYMDCATTDLDDRQFRTPGHNTYENLMANIYLREARADQECFFDGFRGKRIIVFERQDLAKSFLEQLTGNCTLHNYKKALMILYDMDELVFGLFEDTLVHGLDKMITDFLEAMERRQSPLVVAGSFAPPAGAAAREEGDIVIGANFPEEPAAPHAGLRPSKRVTY